MKILFWLRKQKTNKTTGLAPIYCTITLNKERAIPFSTEIFCQAKEWIAKKQTIIGNENGTKRLDLIRDKIEKTLIAFETMRQDVTAQELADISNGKPPKRITLIFCYKEYLKDMEKLKLIGELEQSTIDKENYRLKNIMKFLSETKQMDILAQNISYKFCLNFQVWAKPIGANDHIQRHIQAINRVLKFAVRSQLIEINPISEIQCKFDEPKEIIYLEPEQLNLLCEYKFANINLQRVADLFIFQCYTGFDYGDLCHFQLCDININKKMSNWQKWVKKKRQKKKGKEAIFPLLPMAEKMIQKYTVSDLLGNNILHLPLATNQSYNRLIKEVAQVLGFEQHLTTHVGRKTFGMLVLNEGFSLEATSKFLGHKSIKTTERHYAKVIQRRLDAEVNNVMQISDFLKKVV